MSYLYDLIEALDNQELKQISATPVIGKEQAVLLYFIANKNRQELNSHAGAKQFGVSVTHFDKIKSVLLNKVFEQLVPGGGWALLNFFDSKRVLYHLFYRELLQQEKQLLEKNTSSKKRYEFYNKAFHLCSILPLKFLDDKVNSRMAKMFLKYSQQPVDEIIVKRKLLVIKINRLAAAGRLEVPVIHEKMLKEIKQLEKESARYKNANADYQMLMLHVTFFNYTNQSSRSLDYLQRALELLEKKQNNFSEADQYYVRQKFAEALYFSSRFDEALASYCAVERDFPKLFVEDSYANFKLIQLLMITGNYFEAQQRLDKDFSNYNLIDNPSISVRTAITYAQLYLLKGEFSKAWDFILKGKNRVSKNLYIQYEIELRNLENAFFYLTNEKLFARNLARKNLKFLTSKGLTLRNNDFGIYYSLIAAIHQWQVKGKLLSIKQRQQLDYCQKGSWGIYGKLLKMILVMK